MKSRTGFVYVTYICATPEKLWEALTEPAFTRRYWGIALQSDWKVGSKILWQADHDGNFEDLDQVVLESDPPRRLSYNTGKQAAGLVEDRWSKVTFEIEPTGPMVKLTVTHNDFQPDSEMLKGISQGWPRILSALKTLLETGDVPPVQTEA